MSIFWLFCREKVELFKELRKLRQKQHGVSAVALALGKKVGPEDEGFGVCILLENWKSCKNIMRFYSDN